jgi:hypothetical protein
MKNVGLGFLLLASAELCSAHRCLAQERPKWAGTRNRVVAALTWPVRAYYFETKQTFRDLRDDQMLRAEAAALFGTAAFENATLEVSYRQNPTTRWVILRGFSLGAAHTGSSCGWFQGL